MEKRIDFSRWLMAFDLAIVSIWAVCACWCLGQYSLAYMIVVPLIILRLSMSFALYRRERNVLWLVGGSIAIIGLMFAAFGDDALRILFAPMTKFVETVWRFFSHDNSLMHGAYQFLAHPREEGIESGGAWMNVAIWILSAFAYLTPIVWSAVLLCTKRFEKVKWSWKRLIGYGVCYILFSAIILFLTALYLPLENGARSFWGIDPLIVWAFGAALLAIPFMRKWHPHIPIEVKEFSVMLLVIFALLVGFVMPNWGSLFVMLLCSSMMIYLLCRKWDGATWKESYWLYAFILPANVCFWSSQFVIDFWRYALVFLSFGLVIAGAAFYYVKKHKPIKTLILAVCLGVLIPFFSLGYNVLACTEAKRIGGFEQYPYSWRGLLLVEGKDGIGIRDRYGMVIPPVYDRIEYMGLGAPYVKLQKDGLWCIADLETHAVLCDCKYLSVEPLRDGHSRNYRVWALGCEYDGDKYFMYFKAPKYYSRFDSYDWDISSEPLMHALTDELYLDYLPENVNNPEILDEFLARMLRSVWDKDENTSYADHYWQWAQKTTADIDSLNDNLGMFHCDSLDRYQAAMQQIDDYIYDAGTQLSMNNCSYVYAIGRNYLMHRKNIELADAVSEADLRQEYRLFNEYQSYAEDFWEDVHEAIYGHYSDRPREVNMEAAERFDARADQVTKFLDVIENGKSIHARGARPSLSKIKKAFHEKMPGIMRPVGIECEYPTDTIGMYFLKWIDFRDRIANEMPAKLATSYRNQTTNIILQALK